MHDERARPVLQRWVGERVPWHRIVERPTPVERLGDVERSAVWIKRDDLTHASYGGNKVRKLEFLIGDALAHGRSALWTIGAIGSNHCLATAVHGSRAGLSVEALHVEQPVTEHVSATCRAFFGAGGAARLVAGRNLPFEVVRRRLRAWLEAAGEPVYFVPAGGSSSVGALGYVEAALELDAQIASGMLPEPDLIVVTAGTCGTLVGLRLGLALAERPIPILGVRVVDRALCNTVRIDSLSARVARTLRRAGADRIAWSRVPVQLDHTAFGDGYGVATSAALAAVEDGVARGIPSLETTYTGKTWGALLERANTPHKMLYWHTLNSAPIDAWSSLRPVATLPAAHRALLLAARAEDA